MHVSMSRGGAERDRERERERERENFKQAPHDLSRNPELDA